MSPAAPKTVGQLVLEYVASRSDLARDTRYRYRTILLGFAEFVDGVAPADLSSEHVRAWLQSRECGPTTLAHELGIVRGWCQWLVLAGHCPSEATLGVKRERSRRKRVPLAPEDLERVLVAPAALRTRLIVSLTVREALRPIEIAELRARDIDLERSSVWVRGRHARGLPLTQGTAELLRAYLRLRPDDADALIVSEPPSAPCAISAGRVGELILTALKASGVKKRARDSVDASGLRHAAMVGWRAKGADPAGIGQAGGYRALAEVDAQHRPWTPRDLSHIIAPAPTLPAHGEPARE